MTIEFAPGRRFVGVWFASLNGGGADWMAGAWEDSDGWHVVWRLRSYTAHPTDPFADDQKRWHGLKFNGGTADRVKHTVDQMVDAMAPMIEQHWFCDMRGAADPRDQMLLLAKEPWAHFQLAEPEEIGTKGKPS